MFGWVRKLVAHVRARRQAERDAERIRIAAEGMDQVKQDMDDGLY